jgi:hypothetical protein
MNRKEIELIDKGYVQKEVFFNKDLAKQAAEIYRNAGNFARVLTFGRSFFKIYVKAKKSIIRELKKVDQTIVMPKIPIANDEIVETEIVDLYNYRDIPDFIKEEYLHYLDRIKDSGKVNMFGAARPLQEKFNNELTYKVAKEVVMYWIETYAERNSDYEND